MTVNNFKRESWSTIQDEGLELIKNHYLEVSHNPDIPLDPDHETYLKIEELGNLRVFTARSDDLRLVGYAVFFVKANMHYKSSFQAVQDILYIDKGHRGFGNMFINWCDMELKKENVQIVYHHVKKAHDFGKMLLRMNYELVDLIYARRLDKERGD